MNTPATGPSVLAYVMATLVLALLALSLWPSADDRLVHRYSIDPALLEEKREVHGFRGGPPRPLGAVAGPDGSRVEFVVGELIVRTDDRSDLDELLSQLDASLIDDGISGRELSVEQQDALAGWYLIEVESAIEGAASRVRAGDFADSLTFSSRSALDQIAFLEMVDDPRMSLNVVLQPQGEHPIAGGEFTPTERWWMSNDGLSVGIGAAWDHVEYVGVPRDQGLRRWAQARVAVLDQGFALDEASGRGNPDYQRHHRPPFQRDLIDLDHTAGGPGNAWHGQMVFGVCCAVPDNGFGTAGTGGDYVSPMLFRRPNGIWGLADAIRAAAFYRAEVIVVASKQTCFLGCREPWNSRWRNGEEVLQNRIGIADAWGSVVVVSAGNDNMRLDDNAPMPCRFNGVICVGSIDELGNNIDNWGPAVDIWAPSGIRSTVGPPSAGFDADDTGEDELMWATGTSTAAPFVAGVVGMMKFLDHTLSTAEVKAILEETANPSADPKVTGYVNALEAVRRVRPNLPPVVTFTPPPSSNHLFGPSDFTHALDPEGGPIVVTYRSDIDGPLSPSENLLTPGMHRVSVRAEDPMGGVATASASVNIVNQPPHTVVIFSPTDSQVFPADRTVRFGGLGRDFESDVSLEWRSDRDGQLGGGPTIQSTLSEGAHVVTLLATDRGGLVESASVRVLVEAPTGGPTALITSPLDRAHVEEGVPVSLMGHALDPQGALIPGVSLVWTSDLRGVLGSGVALFRRFGDEDPCGFGEEVVTLTVTDPQGRSASESIVVTFGRPCE